jgi:outer membrane lipoprotein-sorting protein
MSRKIKLVILAFLLITLGLQAQDHVLLERIRQVNSAATSFESDLQNSLIKPNKNYVQYGKLHFVKPDKFSAVFTTGRYMIANPDHLKMDIGAFHGRFKLRKSGGMMRSLCNIFLYGFQGRCQDLADENDYSIEIQEEDQCYKIVLTNNNRVILGLGFKQVILKYRMDSLKLKEIILVEKPDSWDSYSISNVKYNVKVDPKKFEF